MEIKNSFSPLSVKDMIDGLPSEIFNKSKPVLYKIMKEKGYHDIRIAMAYIQIVGLYMLHEEEINGRIDVPKEEAIKYTNDFFSSKKSFVGSAEFVYFIRDRRAKVVKIGYSKNPAKRLKSLQSSSANRLELTEIIPGDIKLEKEIHTKFEDYRIRGEWFQFSKELNKFIQSIGCLYNQSIFQLCTNCGKVNSIFNDIWSTCCLLTFDFPENIEFQEK